MQKNDKKELTWFDHAIGTIISFPIVAAIHILVPIALRLIWPALRGMRNLVTTKSSVARPLVSKENNLPTPDIFKGMPNLARAKDIKF